MRECIRGKNVTNKNIDIECKARGNVSCESLFNLPKKNFYFFISNNRDIIYFIMKFPEHY